MSSVINPIPSPPHLPTASPSESTRMRRWERITVLLLLIGYAGYYFCRADLSVSTPLILLEFKSRGIDKIALGGFVSLGTLAYAFGKFVNGSITDVLGGRRMFLTGMGGAIIATMLFSLGGGLPIFTMAWVFNRLIQSTGWVGLVSVTGKWFSFSRYGAAMGVISLSYLFGDFASRLSLGHLLNIGFGWREIFYVAAGILGLIFIANLIWLKNSPKEVGEPEPLANPENVYGAEGNQKAEGSLAALLVPLLKNPTFWTVCALSFGFTIVRETFQDWSPDYLTDVAGMKAGVAAQVSSLFPLFGGLSVLACGALSDRLGRTGRPLVILVGLILTIPALLTLAYAPFGSSVIASAFMVGATAFVMIGPYSFLAGAIALDFGGKRGSATAAGWIDGIGYIGGTLSGAWIGGLAQKSGWQSAFFALTAIIALTCIAAAIYLRQQMKSPTIEGTGPNLHSADLIAEAGP